VRTSATKDGGTQQLVLLEVATKLLVQRKQNQNSIQLQIKWIPATTREYGHEKYEKKHQEMLGNKI
jgi:hypothetical protein